jgi:hypothetical protein
LRKETDCICFAFPACISSDTVVRGKGSYDPAGPIYGEDKARFAVLRPDSILVAVKA